MSRAFSYETITTPAGKHYRVRDAADNRIATCYCEGNAMLIVAALNRPISDWLNAQVMREEIELDEIGRKR